MLAVKYEMPAIRSCLGLICPFTSRPGNHVVPPFSILAFDFTEQDLSDRIRHDAYIFPNILGPFHPGWELEVVMEQDVCQQHLDLVAGEEAAGTSVRTHPPVQLVRVVGADELVGRC